MPLSAGPGYLPICGGPAVPLSDAGSNLAATGTAGESVAPRRLPPAIAAVKSGGMALVV
jgi:hypothetical protein